MGSVTRAVVRYQLARLAGRVGLRGALRRLYRYCLAPSGGQHGLCVGGQTARFYVYSKSNIRALESLGGERPTLEFLLAKLKPGDTVYDVGAATGLYTILLAKAVGDSGQVVAFEPEDHTYERLCEHLRLNHLKNVRAFRFALGDAEGSVLISVGGVAGSSRIIGPADWEKGGPVECIRVAEGDKFVQAERLPVPRAVKIDVEGYEFAVISGLRRTLVQPQCEAVCCEVHPDLLPASTTPEKVLDLLRSLGFGQIEVHPREKDLHAWAVKAE